MFRIGSIFVAPASRIVLSVAFVLLLPAVAWAADCAQWDISGHWEFRQTNGLTVEFELQQTGDAISGTGKYCFDCSRTGGEFAGGNQGPVTGTVNGNSILLNTSWGSDYAGGVGSDAFIGGTTSSAGQKTAVGWRGNRAATCQPEPSATTPPSHPEKPVKKLGKRLPGTSRTSTLPEKPVKKLGKQYGVAKANDNVDIYKGPGGQFGAYQCGQLNCFMSKDETAKVLDFQDDWYKVETNKVPNGSGWVAGDHLTVKR